MRFIRLQNVGLALSLLAFAGFMASTATPIAQAQTNTTGDIAGNIQDTTGAVVPGATVSVTNLANGATRSTTTNPAGEYRVSQLSPGRYTVSIIANGFDKTTATIDVAPNSVGSGNIILAVGKTAETVEVTAGEVALLHTDDAQISTTFTQEQLQSLPNPGNDITFIAQTAPGSVMDTQSEYGNFSSFGLPGTSNTFTVNGGYYNDPFLNVNNSGATNLSLGANDISSVTVTSNAYNASFGGLGGAQVSETSKSGGNKFHGNAAYWWNGRTMNANDFFNKQAGQARPFDNVNQWAASIGGPIARDKTFFFANYEGLDIILPTRQTVYAPDADYQSNTLQNLATNGLSSEIPVYQNMFNQWKNAKGYSSAVPSSSDLSTGGYGTVSFNATASNYTHEYLFNGRVDHTFSDRDHVFGHATIDQGVQATYTSLLNPLFDAASPQPSYEGQLAEQHIFTPSLSNQFLFSTIYYRALFDNTNEAASEQLVPFTILWTDGDLGSDTTGGSPGGENVDWPQGRMVTGYQFQDDLSWSKGKHTLSVGWTMRRNDITDYSPGEFNTSPLVLDSNASFQQGYTDLWEEEFPTRSSQPVALYTMGGYGQDQWKVLPNLTLTLGLRLEHNSNPICRTDCFARLNNNFAALNTSTNTPYTQLINYNQQQALAGLQMIGWEPRAGFAYLPFGTDSKTTLRGGFGMFSDTFPGQVADNFLNNAPSNFVTTLFGPAYNGPNYPLVPAAAGSARSVATAQAAAFRSGFAAGGTNTSLGVAPQFNTAVTKIYNPSYVEWSMAIEQQVGKNDSFSIMYVGNRGYHEPEINFGVNAWNAGGVTGFPELSTTGPVNPNFGLVDEVSSSAISNYNGVVFTGTHRSRGLTVTVNYQYSHSLDEISNGGFDQFNVNSEFPDNPNNLRDNYGNSDYDTRHYVSGAYVYNVPHLWGPRLLVDNWEVAGTAFHSTGLPVETTDGATAGELGNYTNSPLFAKQIAPLGANSHCGGVAAAEGTACAFAADYTSATDFGQSGRNQLFGPNFTDTDFSVSKGFNVPGWDSGKLKVGAQFFNLFNHPNFGQPGANVGSTGNYGLITNDVSTPTSILGAFLGGNADARLIQLNAKFDF